MNATVSNIITELTRYLRTYEQAGHDPLSPSEAREIIALLDQWTNERSGAAQPADLPGETLTAVREEIGECTRCKLCKTRNHIVFGEGNPQAELMFIGEAPGREEDRAGKPFVGEAGRLLTRIINAIAMQRTDVYIANIIKCRPPQNRNPERDEIASCFPFLARQIDSIQPKVICALGTFAAQTLLETNEPISRLRGRRFPYGNSVLVPTYHPASLLRNPQWKRPVWEDVQLVQRLLEGKA